MAPVVPIRRDQDSLDSMVPGWRFRLSERSAGVYEVVGTDTSGRRVTRQGTGIDRLIDDAAADARALLGSGHR